MEKILERSDKELASWYLSLSPSNQTIAFENEAIRSRLHSYLSQPSERVETLDIPLESR